MKRPGEAEKPRRPPCAPHLRRCSSGSHSGSIPNHGDPAPHLLQPQNLAPLHQAHLHVQSSANGNLLYFQGTEEPTLLCDAAQRCSSSIPAGPRSPPPHLPPHLYGSPPPPNLDGVGCPSTVSSGGGFGVGMAGGPCQAPGHGDPLLQAILEEVRYMADRFRQQDQAACVADQWKFAGAVIDRLCLVAFSVFNIICTISILLSAPNFADAVSKDFV